MLDPSVTLGDVVDRLRNPLAYLRRALDALHVAQRLNPGATLRIGVKGDGAYPNYRMDRADGGPIAAFNGRTYAPLTSKDALADENWSRASVDLDTVRRLMREIAARHAPAPAPAQPAFAAR